MHCLPHSLRLSLSSIAQLHDTLAILGALLFTFVMGFSASQASKRRGWYFWNLIFATALEAAGCAAYAIHSQNQTNHFAFLISFTTTNLAPSFLAMSAFSLFGQHISSAIPVEVAGTRSRAIKGSSVFVLVQPIVLVLIDLCVYHVGSYLSSSPIDGINGALARFSHFERATKILIGAHVLQLLFFAGFTVFTAYWTAWLFNYRSNELAQKKIGRYVFASVSVATTMCMFRSAAKIAEYLSTESAAFQFLAPRSAFWLLDALPILAALIVLCAAFTKVENNGQSALPYTYSLLPEIKVVCVDEELSLGCSKS